VSILEQLRRKKDNRGLMASLRCYLIASKKHRAYPALNSVYIRIDNTVGAFVASLYATHPKEIYTGNIGDTCKTIMHKRDGYKDSDKLTPTERRFQNLLAADSFDELSERLIRIVLMAKSQDVPVNYERLLSDLDSYYRYGKDRVFQEWASSFWNYEQPTTTEDK
jgi:CRISPR system Cascade subunit CasB